MSTRQANIGKSISSNITSQRYPQSPSRRVVRVQFTGVVNGNSEKLNTYIYPILEPKGDKSVFRGYAVAELPANREKNFEEFLKGEKKQSAHFRTGPLVDVIKAVRAKIRTTDLSGLFWENKKPPKKESKDQPSIAAKKGTFSPLMCPPRTADGTLRIDKVGIDLLSECLDRQPQTKDIWTKNGQYVPERRSLHTKIVLDFLRQKPCIVKDKPVAILTGGPPGSGKSTFIRKFAPWMLSGKMFVIDADDVRSKLPEYEGWNANSTHKETKDIVNRMLDAVGTPCRTDLLYDGTMNKAVSYIPLLRKIKSMGYEVYVIYMQVPKKVSKGRVLSRYRETGRYVPLSVVDDIFDKGMAAFDEVTKMADGFIRVDGMTGTILEKGGKPIPTERRYENIACGEVVVPTEGTMAYMEVTKSGNCDDETKLDSDLAPAPKTSPEPATKKEPVKKEDCLLIAGDIFTTTEGNLSVMYRGKWEGRYEFVMITQDPTKKMQRITGSTFEYVKASCENEVYTLTEEDATKVILKKDPGLWKVSKAAMKKEIVGNYNLQEIQKIIDYKWSNVRPIDYQLEVMNPGLSKIMEPFVGKDELRPVMSYLYFDKENSSVVATNGYTLIALSGKLTTEGLYGINGSGPYDDGKFPNWTNVIPTEENREAVYQIDALELFNFCKIVVDSKVDEIKNTAPFLNDLGLNCQFVMDAMKSAMLMGWEKPFINFFAPNRAIVITKGKSYKAGQDSLILTMPVMISDKDNLNRIGDIDRNYFIDNVYRLDRNAVRLKDGSFTSVSNLIGIDQNTTFTDFFGQIEMDLKKKKSTNELEPKPTPELDPEPPQPEKQQEEELIEQATGEGQTPEPAQTVVEQKKGNDDVTPEPDAKEPEPGPKPELSSTVQKIAQTAWYGTSFSPEKRAKTFVKEYSDQLASDVRTLERIPEDERRISVEDYIARYNQKLAAYVAAKSRTMSSMITGPANFPVNRNQKALQSERNRYNEFAEWREKMLTPLKKRFNPSDADKDLQKQRIKVANLEKSQQFMKDVNAAYRKYKKNPESINSPEISASIRDAVVKFNPKDRYSWEQQPFPSYSLTNNNATLKAAKARLEEMERKVKMAEGPVKSKVQISGTYNDNPIEFELFINTQIDRIQLLFDGKPDADVRNLLKRNAFKWSPSQKAWQRTNNNPSISAVGRILREIGFFPPNYYGSQIGREGLTEEAKKVSKYLYG